MVSLSVPNTNGMGPIIIRAPPLVLPRARESLKNIRRVARKVTASPAKIRITPTVKRLIWPNTSFNPRILGRMIQISFNTVGLFSGVFECQIMPFEDMVQQILSCRPDLTREEILTMVKEKEREAKGFLTRESATRAVAAELGLEGSEVTFKRRIPIGHLVSGLGDVTVTCRVLLVQPLRKFIRLDGSEGKVRRLFLADKTGEMKVVLWDDKAETQDIEDLTGRIVRFSHGYVRRGFHGGLELNMGSKGKIETAPDSPEDEFPPLSSFFKKIGEITGRERTVNVLGVAGRIYAISTFNRDDGSEGKVRRLELEDQGDSITVVLWNTKVDELAGIESGRYLEILGGKVRESVNGMLELHVDSSADTAVLARQP